MGFLINELLHSLVVIVVTYVGWARDREGIGAKLPALSIPVVPIGVVVWFVTS